MSDVSGVITTLTIATAIIWECCSETNKNRINGFFYSGIGPFMVAVIVYALLK